MSASRAAALSYLAWRALVAHPWKRLAQRGTGAERFARNYEAEGLVPPRAEDRAIGEAASACIGCGLCETGCDLAAASPVIYDGAPLKEAAGARAFRCTRADPRHR